MLGRFERGSIGIVHGSEGRANCRAPSGAAQLVHRQQPPWTAAHRQREGARCGRGEQGCSYLHPHRHLACLRPAHSKCAANVSGKHRAPCRFHSHCHPPPNLCTRQRAPVDTRVLQAGRQRPKVPHEAPLRLLRQRLPRLVGGKGRQLVVLGVLAANVGHHDLIAGGEGLSAGGGWKGCGRLRFVGTPWLAQQS
jgi:hypothetical protein